MTAAGVVPVGMVTDLQVKLDEISSSVDAQLSEIEAQHATALAAVAAELHKKWTAKMAALEKEMCELEDSANRLAGRSAYQEPAARFSRYRAADRLATTRF